MVYKKLDKEIVISISDLMQIRNCLLMAKDELEGAVYDGWVTTTGIEEEMLVSLDTIASLFHLNETKEEAIINEK